MLFIITFQIYKNNGYLSRVCIYKILIFLLQESDILESPGIYYRSSLMDKVSDYEDIWGPESNNCSTFKPMKPDGENNVNNGIMKSKRPDLLPDTLRMIFLYYIIHFK